MFVDSLSIATRGYLEADLIAGGGTPGSPVTQVEPARDHLRIATRGYIILDLTTIPPPGTVICVEFVDDGATSCEVEDHLTEAEVGPDPTDATVDPEFTEAEVGPDPTDFTNQEQC